MGCLKLTYDHEQEPLPFLGIWKNEGLEKNDSQKKDALEEKKWQPVFCISYTPFGLTFNSYSRTASTAQNFKFNQGFGEKTFQGEPGVTFRTERVPELGWDMTKFRMYDYAIGRFINVDPLADIDINYKYSPYSYSFNNPIRWNDPLGDCPCVPSSITNIGNGIARAFESRVNKINNAVSEAADAVGNFVSETVETIEDYIPQVFVSGDNPDGEFFKPNPDGKFNIVIEEEDMNDIKDAFSAASKSKTVNNKPSEKRGSSTADKLNGEVNGEDSTKPDTVFIEGSGGNNFEGTAPTHKVVIDGDTTFIPVTDQTKDQLETQRSGGN